MTETDLTVRQETPSIVAETWKAPRGRLLIAGLVAGAVALVGCNSNELEGSAETKRNPVPEAIAVAAGDACPTGIFNEDEPMATASDVMPGDLHKRSDKPTTNDKDFMSYMLGNEAKPEIGVVCELPTDMAVYTSIFNTWAGGEAGGSRPFGGILADVNKLAEFLGNHPKEAARLVTGPNFIGFIANLKNNEKVVNGGTYYEVLLQDGKVVQRPVVLPEFAVGEVRMIKGDIAVGDSIYSSTNVMIQTNKDNKVYVLESLGGAEIVESDSDTTTTAPQGSNEDNADKSDKNGKKGGSKKNKKGKGEGDSDTGGSAGPDGKNPEAGPDGVTPSPANGGTPKDEGTPTTGKPKPGVPTTAKPATPTTVRPPQTTVPPTVPPTTRPPQTTVPPTTAPPETTTQPKGTVPPTTAPDGNWG